MLSATGFRETNEDFIFSHIADLASHRISDAVQCLADYAGAARGTRLLHEAEQAVVTLEIPKIATSAQEDHPALSYTGFLQQKLATVAPAHPHMMGFLKRVLPRATHGANAECAPLIASLTSILKEDRPVHFHCPIEVSSAARTIVDYLHAHGVTLPRDLDAERTPPQRER